MSLYFIGIVAPDDINSRALEWKNYMFQHFNCRVALRSPAHITLISPFHLNESERVKLVSDMLDFSSGRRPFGVRLRNFSSFPPRVIFAGVEPSGQLTGLQTNLEEYLVVKNYPINRSTRPFHPHITIANRDLRKEDYHIAFNYFKTISFNASFTATHIDLLISKPKGWVIVSHVPMQTFDMQ